MRVEPMGSKGNGSGLASCVARPSQSRQSEFETWQTNTWTKTSDYPASQTSVRSEDAAYDSRHDGEKASACDAVPYGEDDEWR
jgi:hypothetical protein